MKKRVLVVDDERNITTYLRTLLEDNGYETTTANDGNEGLGKAREEKPDAIALDLLMPKKTGIKLFRELRKDEALRDIPIIVVTGIAREHETLLNIKRLIGERRTSSPDAYLEKPINDELAKSQEP
jgi:CheY-like chemotaxis protein